VQHRREHQHCHAEGGLSLGLGGMQGRPESGFPAVETTDSGFEKKKRGDARFAGGRRGLLGGQARATTAAMSGTDMPGLSFYSRVVSYSQELDYRMNT